MIAFLIFMGGILTGGALIAVSYSKSEYRMTAEIEELKIRLQNQQQYNLNLSNERKNDK